MIYFIIIKIGNRINSNLSTINNALEQNAINVGYLNPSPSVVIQVWTIFTKLNFAKLTLIFEVKDTVNQNEPICVIPFKPSSTQYVLANRPNSGGTVHVFYVDVNGYIRTAYDITNDTFCIDSVVFK